MATTTVNAPAGLWLRLFGLCVLGVAGAVALTLFTPPFYGDLTRVARLSESDFGWRDNQPDVDRALLKSSAIADADVLVIGDSFSKDLVWQSVLTQAGLRVATVSWRQTGPLCADFSSWVKAQGFRGQRVVLQSVERELDALLEKMASCSRMASGPIDARHAQEPPLITPPPWALNKRETWTTGPISLWRTARTTHSSADERAFDKVRVVRQTGGCTRFSHRACEWSLLWGPDRERPALSDQSLVAMSRFSAAHPELKVTWAVVPNKSSVYQGSPSLGGWAEAVQAKGLGPDLFAPLIQARDGTKDLYLPNDTHLSTRGYLLLGQRLLQTLQAQRPVTETGPAAFKQTPASSR